MRWWTRRRGEMHWHRPAVSQTGASWWNYQDLFHCCDNDIVCEQQWIHGKPFKWKRHRPAVKSFSANAGRLVEKLSNLFGSELHFMGCDWRDWHRETVMSRARWLGRNERNVSSMAAHTPRESLDGRLVDNRVGGHHPHTKIIGSNLNNFRRKKVLALFPKCFAFSTHPKCHHINRPPQFA